MNFLDPYHEGHSLVHQLDARIKLVLVVAFILTTALIPSAAWPVYILLASLAFAAELLTELGLGFFLKRALLAVPFVLAALPVLFTIPGPALLTLPFGLVITGPVLARFISVAVKSWLSVQMAILLAATTRFPEILMAMRSLRLPKLLVAIIGLMWRYLFVMVEEALRLMHARQARSGINPALFNGAAGKPAGKVGGSISWRGKVTGNMAGSLFIRSLERSDHIYNAMLARGYDGEIRGMPQTGLTSAAWATLIVGLGLLGALLLFGYLL